MDNQRLDQIDSFLRNELTEAEELDFKKELNSNPELNTEFQFQKEVFEGINAFKHQAWKARFDAIDVSGTQPGIFAGGLAKTAAALIGIVTVGVGIWYFTVNDDHIGYLHTPTISITNPNKEDFSKWETRVMIQVPEKTERKPIKDDGLKEPVTTNSPAVVIAKTNKKSKATENVSAPIEVQKPQLVGLDDETSFEADDITQPEMSNGDVFDEKNALIDVEIKPSQGQLRYKYYDGKLFLYGDFQQETYQILEINRKTGREVFLYFQEDYFPIKIVDEISDLRSIKNAQSINELEILRKNKSE